MAFLVARAAALGACGRYLPLRIASSVRSVKKGNLVTREQNQEGDSVVS